MSPRSEDVQLQLLHKIPFKTTDGASLFLTLSAAFPLEDVFFTRSAIIMAEPIDIKQEVVTISDEPAFKRRKRGRPFTKNVPPEEIERRKNEPKVSSLKSYVYLTMFVFMTTGTSTSNLQCSKMWSYFF